MSTTTQYNQLNDPMGSYFDPIRLPSNVVNHHIKKTADKKDFVLGNSIVTDRYASSICMITTIVPNDNQSDTFEVTLHDGTHELNYSAVSKSLIPPEVWAKLFDCSLDDANNWIKDSAQSNPLLKRLSKYPTSSNYPIIVEFMFKLNIRDGHTDPGCRWCSCKLFDDYPVAEKKITQQSEEWYNIIWKENIEKGATFYKDYCLTSSQRLSLQTNTFHPPYCYHPIFDNPCYPIPMTCANMWEDTKPTTTTQQDGKQQPKLFYHGKDITGRLAYITVYVANNTIPCPKTPKCSGGCKYVNFKDNSIGGALSHLTKYPAKDSTCYHLYRLNVNLVDDKATISANNVLSSTIGKKRYKNQTLLDEHQAKALQFIEDVNTIDIQYKKYITSLNVQYNTHIEQIKHFYSLATSHLSAHPLFSALIEPLQQQLEDVMVTSKEEQHQECDTPESLSKLLGRNSTTSDLLLQCKQIIKEYIDSVKIQYNKHTKEQIKHYYTLIAAHLSSHPLFATLIEPLQKQLETTMLAKPKEQHQQVDTIEQLNNVIDWYNTISELSLNCKQIIDTLLNTNIALYNDFYDYYLPHVDEQLHHLQQQMQFLSSSNNNNNNNRMYPIPQSSSSTTSQTSSSSSTLFNYQRNVIRPIAQYRHRAHLVPPLSSSIFLSSHNELFNNIMTSPDDNNNNPLLSSQHHPTLFSQSSSSDIHSLAQQHTLEVSLARQRMLVHAVDFEHSIIDIQNDKIIELKQQIKTLQTISETRDSRSEAEYGEYESEYNTNLKLKDKQLEIQNTQLAEKDKQLELQHQHYITQLQQKDKQLEAKDKQLESKDKQFELQLQAKDKQLETKDKQLEAKDKQIEMLLKMLAEKS